MLRSGAAGHGVEMSQAIEKTKDVGAERWALAGLSLSMLMPSLDTSIANVGLPSLARGFGASFQQAQWVVLAYLLAITCLIVSAGRLGDLFGRRRLLAGGIGLFTLASLACGLAPSLELLVAARAAQGLGAAMMMALTLALAGEMVPKVRIGAAMGLLGTMSAIGTTLGPALGGVLIAGFGWRAIFLVNLPLGILNLVLALRTLPADPPAARTRRAGFDGRGTLLLALTLGAYALAMTLGGGRFGLLNGALLAAAASGAATFLWVEARVASPLIRPAMFADPTLGAGLAMGALVSTVMMSTLVVGPFYLTGALGLDAARAGLVLSAGPLAAALAGAPAGRLADRFGAGRMTAVGLGGMAAGLLALCTAAGRLGAAGYVCAIVAVTVSYALFQAANTTRVVAGTDPGQRGVVSGMVSLARNLGLITGASAMGAVFAFGAGTGELAAAPPEAVAAGMRWAYAVAGLLVLLALGIATARPSPRPQAA